MLGLAGHSAGVTADTYVLVDDKAVSQDVLLVVIARVTLGTDQHLAHCFTTLKGAMRIGCVCQWIFGSDSYL